jgi:prepilin-type processing-associated H-X9-DG protein
MTSLAGYAMNSQGFTDADATFNLWALNNAAYFMPKVKNPSNKLIHIDSNDWSAPVSYANPARTALQMRVEYRHSGMTANTLFFDGHAAPRKPGDLYFPVRGGKDCWDSYNSK